MKYRSSFLIGRWFFGFTLQRFSVFVAWKCPATWRNYADYVLNQPQQPTREDSAA